MLCKYSYLTTDEKEHGPYLCDTEDFRNFMKYRPRDISSMIVWLRDGDIWIWTPKVKRGKRTAGGWQFVKNTFWNLFKPRQKCLPPATVVEPEVTQKPLDFQGALIYLFS